MKDYNTTTWTGFSGADMAVYDGNGYEYENVMYFVQAISFQNKSSTDGKIGGSLVLCGVEEDKKTAGPHDVVITMRDEEGQLRAVQVVYKIKELLDEQQGKWIDWNQAEVAKCYPFVAEGATGVIKK